MGDSVIHLIFIGLIAFVPQDGGQTNFMTAYLVKDNHTGACDHIPSLTIDGTATVESGELCRGVGRNLECSLAGVSVTLDTRRTRAALPPKPSQERPVTKAKDDGGSPAWLVRMVNVEPSAAKPKAQLSQLADAEFTFGWEEALTCALDENGEKKVRAFKFVDGQHESDHRQALAETVMFISKVGPGLVKLTLTKGTDVTVVSLDCSSGRCPVLRFSNEVGSQCTPEQAMDHFLLYYPLAERADHKPIPRRAGNTSNAEDVTFDCAAVIVSSSARAQGLSLEKIRDLKEWRAMAPMVRPKPDDRLICPPVVFGQ